ncbi:uncharacterized protein [Aegilops tauschii subsp. strangulata]|uniref:uncharacterized protein n=1 Tax=Aegilops tauschii subsp. strangulata TaxID=200361 RepID=UPI001ABC2252|nr:uncharacterized protein LOC120974214 [Aegilops tauschii subsp. strangulata]
MSAYMLAHLCGLVTGGHRPSTSFKNVHWNGCAAAMNEHFQRTDLIGTHITNHTRTWKKKYKEIVHLKSLSGALWDEDNFMIVLDHEHYTNHIKDHKEDEPFLNKPIKHYEEMLVIVGAGMATGQYAKGSSDPLATEKAKTNPSAEDRMVATMMASSERLAVAIEKFATDVNPAIDGLWDEMKELPGFDVDSLAHYYAYLVDNPRVATTFKVPEGVQRKVWVSMYVKSISYK